MSAIFSNNLKSKSHICINGKNSPFLLSHFTGAPNEKNGKNVSNAVFCFLISFYGLLKGYLCELIIFDLFGCGS